MNAIKSTNAAAAAVAADAWADDELNVDDLQQLQRLLDEPAQNNSQMLNLSDAKTKETLHDFDAQAAGSWIYPSNLPCRAYQQSIAQVALLRNTLVVLPTGLGKTFIAAVVMWNIYRWYPQCKIIFMAPTRPLVAQQIDACKRIMPFPNSATTELTGKLPRSKRAELWKEKRVFFATPQVVQSDIVASLEGNDDGMEFPFMQVKLLVVDEAHKAKGRYAYTEVAQAIQLRNKQVRMLALSATPGRSIEDVVEVIRNLFISHLEVRWDNSIDVMPYVHQRKLKTIVVPLGEDIKGLRERLIDIINPFLKQLVDAEVLSGSLHAVNRNFLIYEQKRFRERSIQQRHVLHTSVSNSFSICISLYHALELLERHGLRVFLNHFEKDEEGKTNFALNVLPELRDLVQRLKEHLGVNPFDISANIMTNGQLAEIPKDLNFGHPKFEEARKCLLQHFEHEQDTRAIVFCEYRESVMLMYRLLLQHTPLLKPRCFVGQGAASGGSLRPLTQKQQIQIMADFRAGKSNILIATSIGEEGLDVGEVDFIVCFDISTTNPTRFVQRIGRTGRQKQGNVVMLVTEGREQRVLSEVLANKDQINKKLLRSPLVQNAFYKEAPRLLPAGLNPKCEHMFIQPLQEQPEEQKAVASKKLKTKVRASKAAMLPVPGSQDLRKFFQQKTAMEQLNEMDKDQAFVSQKAASTPKISTQHKKKIDKYFKSIDFLDIIPCSAVELPKTATNTATTSPTIAKKPMPDIKHLRRLTKFLQSSTALLKDSQKSLDLLNQLRNEKETKCCRLWLLKQNVKFVRETVDNMQVLNALELDADSMSAEEQQVRETYELIERLFGGSAELQQFLKQQHDAELYSLDTDALSLAAEQQEQEAFDKAFGHVFKDLQVLDFCQNNYEFLQQQNRQSLMQQKKQKAHDNEPVNISTDSYVEADDAFSLPDETNELSILDSKYCSQWQSYEEPAELPNYSTPIQKSKANHVLCQSSALLNRLSESLAEELEPKNEQSLKANNKQSQQSLADKSMESTAHSDCSKLEQNITTTPNIDTNNDTSNSVNLATTPTSSKSKLLHNLTKLQDSLLQHAKLHNDDTSVSIIDNSHSYKPYKQRTMPTTTQMPDNKVDVERLVNAELADFDLSLLMEPFTDDETETVAPAAITLSKSKSNFQQFIYEKQAERSEQAAPTAIATHETSPASKSIVAKTSYQSPKQQKVTTSQQDIKSPSVFDFHQTNVRRKRTKPFSELLHSKQQCKSITPIVPKENSSPLVLKRKNSKRKIFESSDSDEHVQSSGEIMLNEESCETECEEIAETQKPRVRSYKNLKKRRCLNAFISNEAAVSDAEQASSDECDETIGQYAHDSVIVSDEEAENQAETTHMKAIYLKSLNSPRGRPGAFKIPMRRVYDDFSQVFSQMDDIPESSQYMPDSFVVPETEAYSATQEAASATLCPLERAEKILKERRRAKRQFAKVASVASKKRRVVRVKDSSDEDT